MSILSLLLASNNHNKMTEFVEILSLQKGYSRQFKLSTASEALLVEENGQSYYENALIKAKKFYDKHKVAVFADDSGLEIEALPGQLGVYSARFGGHGSKEGGVGEKQAVLSYQEKCLILLAMMKDIPAEQRGAYFVCTICCYLSPSEIFYFNGRLDGYIAYEAEGAGGFGFDPIFLPREVLISKQINMETLKCARTLACLGDWKNVNSHRARAFKAMLVFLYGKYFSRT